MALEVALDVALDGYALFASFGEIRLHVWPGTQDLDGEQRCGQR